MEFRQENVNLKVQVWRIRQNPSPDPDRLRPAWVTNTKPGVPDPMILTIPTWMTIVNTKLKNKNNWSCTAIKIPFWPLRPRDLSTVRGRGHPWPPRGLLAKLLFCLQEQLLLIVPWFQSKSQWLKITENVSFDSASEASYVYILGGHGCYQTSQLK